MTPTKNPENQDNGTWFVTSSAWRNLTPMYHLTNSNSPTLVCFALSQTCLPPQPVPGAGSY